MPQELDLCKVSAGQWKVIVCGSPPSQACRKEEAFCQIIATFTTDILLKYRDRGLFPYTDVQPDPVAVDICHPDRKGLCVIKA